MEVLVPAKEFNAFLDYCGVDYTHIEVCRWIIELQGKHGYMKQVGCDWKSSLFGGECFAPVYEIEDVFEFTEEFGDLQVLKKNRMANFKKVGSELDRIQSHP